MRMFKANELLKDFSIEELKRRPAIRAELYSEWIQNLIEGIKFEEDEEELHGLVDYIHSVRMMLPEYWKL